MFFGICAGVLSAQELSLLPANPAEGFHNSQTARVAASGRDVRLWKISVASLAAANAMDVQSSWGKHELNGTLAGPSGTFGGQGALIKLGIQGGLLGVEFLITRGHPTGRLFRTLSIVNFGATAVIGGTAAHNYTVARP
jgi:hypothetical protein